MASPKQLAIASLTEALETCKAALESITNALHGSNGLELSVLHKDLLSLLSLLYGSTTKLSLTLKPSSPSYAASQAPIRDITSHISALSHCVCLFGNDHGLTLTQEVTSLAENVIQSVQSLLQTFFSIETTDKRESAGKAGEDYMVRIGAIHDVIDNARNGLSKDNTASVQKRLAQNQESLEDGLDELNEMVARQNGADSVSVDIWEDDGWGELGLDSNRRMNDSELKRAKKVYAILRLSSTLHKRIIQDISPCSLVFSPEWPLHLVRHLDLLPPRSSALVVAFDDLVSTTYTPQDSSDLSSELASFIEVINDLRSNLIPFFQESIVMECTEKTSSHSSTSSKKDVHKWFETCFNQIQKAAEALESMLNVDR